MTQQDVISIKPKIFKHIKTNPFDSVFRDNNYNFLRSLLRHKGPMTVKDIMLEFKKDKNEKSDKTIYRYLTRLGEVGLTSKVGKRVIVDDNNKIRTETLYGTSAYLFLIGVESHPFHEKTPSELIHKREVIAKTVGYFLSTQLDGKKFSDEKFTKFLVKRHTEAQEALVQSIESGDEEILEIVKGMEYYDTSVILEAVSWLGSILSNPKLHKEILDCTE
jgi:hypothetical protein